MIDIFFDKDYLTNYKQTVIEKTGLKIPFSIIKYNNLKSLVSIGYQGPISLNNKFNAEKLLSEIKNTALENDIITIFIRYNPFLNNHHFFKNIVPLETASSCFMIDTKNNFDHYVNKRPSRLLSILKNRYKPTIRTDIHTDKSIIKNALLYNNEYIHNIEDVKKLINSNLAILIQAFNKDEEIAASLFIKNDQSAVYALNYSSEKGKKEYANIFILMHFIEYAFSSGINIIYLGAGLNNDDSLAFFKKQFATHINNVYHSKLIIDNSVYSKYNKGNKYFPSWLENKSIPSLIQEI